MRILMLTSTLPRFEGDIQANFVGEQAAAWMAARPNDAMFILAPHHLGAKRREVVGHVNVERFRYFAPAAAQRLAYPAILPNLRRNPLLWSQVLPLIVAEYLAARLLAKQEQIDVIYAHWVVPQGLVAWRLKRSLGIPYVLQAHSSDLAVFDKAGEAGRQLARAVLREATHFFCVNVRQRDHALALVDPAERAKFAQRCTVQPMGIATAGVERKDGPRFDVGTIGRLSRKKGMDLLILAAERLAARGVRPRLAIAGDGEERKRLEGLVQNADVTFTGFVTGADKIRFLASVDRFAFPAVIADGDVEGLPVALLEALGSGSPVLASRDTNIALLPEWDEIKGAVTFVEDPRDISALERALEKLLMVRPDSVRRASLVVGRYRWPNLIGHYIAPVLRSVHR